MSVGRLHIITDYWFQQDLSHHELAARAIAGGADTIQFRQKHGTVRHMLSEAQRTAEVCRERHVTFLVNDRADVALAVGASGVHVGQEDLPVSCARSLMGNRAIVGATATTLDQALAAQDDGASYIGFGPVFETSSKASPASVKGLDALARVCAAIKIPVIGIAGITADRIAEVLTAGAHGVAVMTAVSLSGDPESATRELARAIRRYTGQS